MKIEHTRGPWHYGEDQRGRKRVFDTTGAEVVRALSTAGMAKRSRAEREANAHLLAAAPDMLVALRKVESVMEALGDRGSTRDAVRAAIAAAVGLDRLP